MKDGNSGAGYGGPGGDGGSSIGAPGGSAYGQDSEATRLGSGGEIIMEDLVEGQYG